MFMRAVHPGEVLKGELEESGISPTEFARRIGVPPNRVSQIIAGKRSVTGDSALRLGHWFGVEPEFWLKLQAQYDIVLAERRAGKAIRCLPTRTGDSSETGTTGAGVASLSPSEKMLSQ